MVLVAFDPGETIGIAQLDVVTGDYHGFQTRDALTASHVVDRAAATSPESTVLIEGFIGGGYRTNAATHTLKVLGFLEYYARLRGITVVIRPPQSRKAYVTQARDMLPPSQRHAADAFAHILSYAKEIGVAIK